MAVVAAIRIVKGFVVPSLVSILLLVLAVAVGNVYQLPLLLLGSNIEFPVGKSKSGLSGK